MKYQRGLDPENPIQAKALAETRTAERYLAAGALGLILFAIACQVAKTLGDDDADSITPAGCERLLRAHTGKVVGMPDNSLIQQACTPFEK